MSTRRSARHCANTPECSPWAAGPSCTLDTTLGVPGLSAEDADQAKEAFVTGLHAAIGVAAALTFALGFLAVRWLPREERDAAAEEFPRRQEQAVS